MALNLNKGNEENSKPNLEKKGLNLSKSGDSNPVNLNKEASEIESGDTTSLQEKQSAEKKKSPVVYIVAAAILLGVGIFWFMNQNGGSGEDLSTTATTDKPNDTAVSQPVGEPQSINETNSSTTENANPDPAVKSNEIDPASSPKVNTPSTVANNSVATPETPTKKSSSSNLNTEIQGSIDEKAKQVIQGDFGNGAERRKALGSEYAEIQSRVNEILKQL